MSDRETSLNDDLALALRLADAADAVSLPRFDEADLSISTKADQSFVTDADLATERAIRDLLADEAPEDSILGEEFGAEGSSRRQWIIDPIDGTASYLRGVPLWGTLIALAVDGVPEVGVVSMPALGLRWWAGTGLGAWAGDPGSARELQVSEVDSLDRSSISFQSITQWRDAGKLDTLLELSALVWRDRAIGDVYPYMLLAEGRLDAVSEFGIQPYDVAAVVPIIREAGGIFTDATGAESITTGSVLATNGPIHDSILSILTLE